MTGLRIKEVLAFGKGDGFLTRRLKTGTVIRPIRGRSFVKKIIMRTRSDSECEEDRDFLGKYEARLDGTDLRRLGEEPNEAVLSLILDNPEIFDITTDWDDNEPED
jgi:hypothetical protein